MIGGTLRYYQQKGEGQLGRGLGGVLRNSLAKIQPIIQRMAKVGKRKALGALGSLLGVRLTKKRKKAPPAKRRRRKGQRGGGGIVAQRTRGRKGMPTDIFRYHVYIKNPKTLTRHTRKMVGRRRRRHWQGGGTVPIAPLVTGAKMLAKEAIKRRKPIMAALGPGLEVGQMLAKKLLAARRRRKKKRSRRVQNPKA